ncbi:MAG: response regulator transcription factor [Mediterranea massiliensis]|nr:response regulator transcription factor [Mediterranea massiliensis]
MDDNEKIRVLLVEDEQTLAMIIKDTLEGQGFNISIANDGEQGLRLFFEQKPHVLVADVMMPCMDGFEMVRRIRRENKHTPILYLTARSAVNDVVTGFEIGANDYLKKPFGMQELMIRIKALLGRAYVAKLNNTKVANECYKLGIYHFNPIKQHLYLNEECQQLSHRESEILRRLCRQHSQVVDMRQLLIELWGDDTFFNQRSLHVFITKLRKRLRHDPSIRIINVRGIGYKLLLPSVVYEENTDYYNLRD